MKALPLLIIVAILATSAHAQLYASGTALNASLLYYQPVPARPGDTLDVYIQVTNSGGTATAPGTIEVLDSGPFTPQSEDDRSHEFPSIPSRQSFLLRTEVIVDRSANEGTASLKIRISQGGTTGSVEQSLPITITGRASALGIVSASTEPEELLPGESADLSITVENVGDTTVRNVALRLDLDELSIAPIGTSNSKTIARLQGGDRHVFVFPLAAFPDAESRAYRLPITLTYDDEQGNEKRQNETVGIVIGAVPELTVYVTAVEMAGGSGTVELRLVNHGLAEIKLAQLRVLDSDEVSVAGQSRTVYVGNIDEDDYETTDLQLSTDSGEFTLPVQVIYRDALNRKYEETFELSVRVPEEERGGSGFIWLVLIALILVGGYLLMRRKRKR